MPLYFDLVPEQYQASFENWLVTLIEDNDLCLDTGFLAMPFLFDTLVKIGRCDIAFKVFYGEEASSYFNQLAQGATTIWESWYTYYAEGNPFNVSLNHYAFGCVDNWIFRTIGGMDKTLPGFKHIAIKPTPDESLTWAKRALRASTARWSRPGRKKTARSPCTSRFPATPLPPSRFLTGRLLRWEAASTTILARHRAAVCRYSRRGQWPAHRVCGRAT